MSSGSILAEAERAAASGDLSHAQALLKKAAAEAPDDVQLLLKLAAVSKAAGHPRTALAWSTRRLSWSRSISSR